jgi:hypothetical protein
MLRHNRKLSLNRFLTSMVLTATKIWRVLETSCMQPIKISLRDCAVIEDSIYFHPTQSIQYSHSYNEDKKDISDETYQRDAKWKLKNAFCRAPSLLKLREVERLTPYGLFGWGECQPTDRRPGPRSL